jgi:hypothetical protein
MTKDTNPSTDVQLHAEAQRSYVIRSEDQESGGVPK